MTLTQYHMLIGFISFGCICSVFAFAMATYNTIMRIAADNSTHTIEFRNPDVEYEDELDIDKHMQINSKTKVSLKEQEPDQDIDALNKFIKEEQIIL